VAPTPAAIVVVVVVVIVMAAACAGTAGDGCAASELSGFGRHPRTAHPGSWSVVQRIYADLQHEHHLRGGGEKEWEEVSKGGIRYGYLHGTYVRDLRNKYVGITPAITTHSRFFKKKQTRKSDVKRIHT